MIIRNLLEINLLIIHKLKIKYYMQLIVIILNPKKDLFIIIVIIIIIIIIVIIIIIIQFMNMNITYFISIIKLIMKLYQLV